MQTVRQSLAYYSEEISRERDIRVDLSSSYDDDGSLAHLVIRLHPRLELDEIEPKLTIAKVDAVPATDACDSRSFDNLSGTTRLRVSLSLLCADTPNPSGAMSSPRRGL